MSARPLPDWFDRHGMVAWAEGMAATLGRSVRIVDGDDRELAAAGTASGRPARFPIEVNGVVDGWVELSPGELGGNVENRVNKAIGTLRSLAEVCYSMADLVRTTAGQWRELSTLYRSSDLLQGGLAPDHLARHLLEHALQAVRCTAGVVRHPNGAGGEDTCLEGPDADTLVPVTGWAHGLESGTLVADHAELRRCGYPGPAPDRPCLLVPVRAGDRAFGAMALVTEPGRMFNAQDLKLVCLLGGQAGQAYANLELMDRVRDTERFRREMELAADIQSSILPPSPIDVGGFLVVSTCTPAERIGGDAVVALPLRGGGAMVAVADVSGHGLSAALLMNSLASQLRALLLTEEDPSRLLAVSNDLVEERVGNLGMFVTAILMRLDPDGTATLANAGHPPPLMILPDGTVTELECDSGPPLGVLPGERYPGRRIPLAPGAAIVGFSDGLVEAADASGEHYGSRRLLDVLRDTGRRVGSPQETLDRVLEDLAAFRGQTAPSDDLTLVVVGRTP